MNEKIMSLMKEAGTDTSGKWMGVEHAEKFAELIVRECLEKVSECVANRDTNRYYHDSDGRKIKQHFGVEG